MIDRYSFCTFHISDCPCHTKHTVIRSCSQMPSFKQIRQSLLFFLSEHTVWLQGRRWNFRVETPCFSLIALLLQPVYRFNAMPDARRTFFLYLTYQILITDLLRLHMQINPVKQRPADSRQIAPHISLPAGTAFSVWIIPAFTGIP